MDKRKHIQCPSCGKPAVEVSRMKFGRESMVKLICGHSMFTKELTKITNEDNLESFLTHDKPFEFQRATLDFVNASGGRCGIFHEQGLGKTVCAALALRQHKAEMLPALIIAKGNLGRQWFKQFLNWVDEDALIQIVESSKDYILPGCQAYIVSYDLLRRLPEEKFNLLNNITNTLIVDECQHIKNVTSQRAVNVRALAKDKKYVMALSGTPIKNHAGEYFSILNILNPVRFPSEAAYYAKYVDSYFNGFTMTVGALKNEKMFRQQTEDFILRYEQFEVMPDLPDLVRDFKYFDIDKDLKKAYDQAENELVDYVNTNEGDSGFEQHQHVLAYLNKMRQITAVAKVPAVADEIEEILLNTNKKVIVFLHHHIARDILVRNLTKLTASLKMPAPLMITTQTSRDKAEEIKAKFRQPDSTDRILILGTLASGEGLDGLQDACNTLIMMERQWNPPNEEQAEKRLHRIGQKQLVTAIYPIAVGTVDEMFTELVEKKRQTLKQTMGDSDIQPWNETSTVKDLVNAIIEKRGGKKWTMTVTSKAEPIPMDLI